MQDWDLGLLLTGSVRNAALRRKGKDGGLSDDGASGTDSVHEVMEHVVHTHNTMNEMTWHRVARWERLHPESSESKLNRFIGRPDELSPLARLRALVWGQRPFDRHDWFVLRDGKEVRYVIDFYFAEERAGYADVRPSPDDAMHLLCLREDKLKHGHGCDATSCAFCLHGRPKLSPEQVSGLCSASQAACMAGSIDQQPFNRAQALLAA
jgi:Cytochrome c/c1 heme lyase